MKIHQLHSALVTSMALGWFVVGVPTWAKDYPAYDFLERSPARIAIIPAVNRTDQPVAQIVIDKAWDKALQKAGYQVLSADRVVTYAAARGMLLAELPKRRPAELGKDLKVELLLTSEILKWETSSEGERAATTVEVVARIAEATTGALVWEHHWVYREEANNEGLGKFIDASLHVASEKAARMADRAVTTMSADKLPVQDMRRLSPRADGLPDKILGYQRGQLRSFNHFP